MRKWPPLMLLWIWGLFALVLCTCQDEEVDIQAVNRMEAEGIWETKSLADFAASRPRGFRQTRRDFTDIKTL